MPTSNVLLEIYGQKTHITYLKVQIFLSFQKLYKHILYTQIYINIYKYIYIYIYAVKYTNIYIYNIYNKYIRNSKSFIADCILINRRAPRNVSGKGMLPGIRAL